MPTRFSRAAAIGLERVNQKFISIRIQTAYFLGILADDWANVLERGAPAASNCPQKQPENTAGWRRRAVFELARCLIPAGRNAAGRGFARRRGFASGLSPQRRSRARGGCIT